MKKIKITLFTAIIFALYCNAQAPFTTLAKEPNYIKTEGKKFIMYDIKKDQLYKSLKTKDSILNTLKDIGVEPVKDSTDVDFFKNSSLALSILNKADNRASVSAQVLFYKVKILTPIDNTTTNYNYNIPIMIISKLSTSYDSISSASAIDVLDYEAAPVTLRIMPSFKVSKNSFYKESLMIGFYADARGINLHNPVNNDYSLEIIGSGGVGFTFQGDGEAGFYNRQGEYEKGNWLFSAMLQAAIGDKQVIQSLFNTEQDYVTSFQSYFVFRIAENNKFNLKIGFQHLFQETLAGTKNNFSIALGL
ncbi:hypothetical protein [Winogradskyella undariae]|uniref:hypothetical protein n=1 Tax=Winogradskyella undariae TaxID=1285465 RepID=UPI0015CA3CBC|nr:hypothetical protein [Winogradskyella undariae]